MTTSAKANNNVTFAVYPLGTADFSVIVTTDAKTYRKYMRAKASNDFRYFTFEVVGISGETVKALCHNADDRGTSRNGWYAHSREYDYNYRRENSREGVRVIDVNTYRK